MGKHDRPSDYETARIEELEKRIAFAEENCRQLRETVARCNKWVKELEAAAEREVAVRDARIAKLEATIVRLAVR